MTRVLFNIFLDKWCSLQEKNFRQRISFLSADSIPLPGHARAPW
jgi:hypothetical protein